MEQGLTNLERLAKQLEEIVMRWIKGIPAVFLLAFGFPGFATAGPLERLILPQKERSIVLFPDVTRSIAREDWKIYTKTCDALSAEIRPGDHITVGTISAQTLTAFRP